MAGKSGPLASDSSDLAPDPYFFSQQNAAHIRPLQWEYMRILMFTGKGGVGKTSLAAATGVKLAALNYRTLLMSIDPAHSLGDSFDLDTDLFHLQTSDPLQVGDRLWIQELNIQKEIKRHWQEISA
jgi:arsenite-transporting ATPase